MSTKPWEIDHLTMNFADLMTEDEVNAIAPMVCAAPAMARALCHAEWFLNGDSMQNHEWWQCPECGASNRNDDEPAGGTHMANCQLDQALTAAGIDAAERQAVRERSR